MHVGMYDCMRSEIESELGNPLSGILRKSKQTNMHTCVSVYVCVYEERQRISVTLVTTAAQGCASDLCTCASARVCWYYFADLSLLCLFVCRCTPRHKHTHTHTSSTKNTGKYMPRNDRKSTLSRSAVSQCSATRNTHTHRSEESPAKTPSGRADNWLLSK